MPTTWKSAVANGFLFFLIYGMSATVDFSHFKTQIKNKKAIGTGILLQFIVLPFLGFAVSIALQLEEIYGIMLLIITSSPGGAYSNWFCSIFNGDLALSVTMTAISTILSIAMLPLNVLIYSRIQYGANILNTLDWPSLGISLVVVISAILLGLFCSHKFDNEKFRVRANKLGNLAGVGLLVFSYLAPEERVNIFGRSLIFYLATPMPIVLGLIASVVIASLFKLEKPERVTVSIECCYQNTSIAIASGLAFFKTDEDIRNALGVPFFYTGMQTLVVGLFALISWKTGWTKCPSDVSFIKMVLGNYQKGNEDIEDHEDDHEEHGITLGNSTKDSVTNGDEQDFHQAETGDESENNKHHSVVY
jgi:predicted Na+-dependent transporter